jgi:hypothetical protein
MNFRKVDDCPLDIIKPYQRTKLSRTEPNDAARECGLTASIGIGSGEWLGGQHFILQTNLECLAALRLDIARPEK